MDKLIKEIEKEHDILEEFDGKIQKYGRYAGEEKNKYWLVKNKITEEEYYIINCGKNIIIKIDKESINKIIGIKNCWYISSVDYPSARFDDKEYYMHQFLMNHYGHGKGQISVDHINQDKFDNRLCNLRLATQSEQNQNTGKRNRKYNAKPLPDGIEQKDLPKYVGYYSEYEKEPDENGNKVIKREFFRIERNPKLNGGNWTSTKSKYVSIQDKLQQTIEKLNEINISL